MYPRLSLQKSTSTLLATKSTNQTITGFHYKQRVLMRHENRLISAEVEAKDRPDQTNQISSAGLAPSIERHHGKWDERVVKEVSVTSDLPLSETTHIPKVSKKDFLWNALHLDTGRPQCHQLQTAPVPVKASLSSSFSPRKKWKRAVEKSCL